MDNYTPKGIVVPKHKIAAIPRQPDGDAFYLHCTGGFRAAEMATDAWKVEPILIDGTPSATGFLSRKELQTLIHQAGFKPIAFQNMGWTNGGYHSSWRPVIPERENHMRGPSELWGSIGTNLSQERTGDSLNNMPDPSLDKVGELLDGRTREEALAKSISLSLRSMDISIEQIAEFYNEQVVNLTAAGRLSGQRSSASLDQTLFSHVHSFFLHLGAARDYLGAYIALKLGLDSEKTDDMARLISKLRSSSFGSEPVLDLLRNKGFLTPKPNSSEKWQVAGWLKDASEMRKQFVHKRPYGLRFSEGFGWLVPVAAEAGIYRYYRPVHSVEGKDRDVLDVIVDHYKNCTALFQDAAEISGQDTAMLTLTDADIISID